ncbi:hypothetical protein FJZ36_08175 [Candidatus Poribacteria bacterium]|nr:hypothetical protein [Candidatus Poribacteria bacterium]
MSLTKRVSAWVAGVVVFVLWSLAMMVAWSATPVMVVQGKLLDAKGAPLDGWEVAVTNSTRNWTEKSVSGSEGPGGWSVVRLDFATNNAADVGDVIKVVATSADKKQTLEESKTLATKDVQNASLVVTLSVPEKPKTPEDLNGDGIIDIIDLVTVARSFGESGAGSPNDINKDGVVDIVDLVLIARRFGEKLVAAPGIATAGEASLAITATGVHGSSDIAVRISPVGSTDIAGYDFELAFDPSRLQMLDVHEGDLLQSQSGTFWQASDATESAIGSLRVIAAVLGDASATTDGEMVEARFRVIGSRAEALRSLRIGQATLATRDLDRLNGVGGPVRLDLRLSRDARTLVGANYPNPFNPETWIPYQLAEDSSAIVRVFDAAGRLVRRLDLGFQPAGAYATRDRAAHWDGRNELGETVGSGVYYYEFRAGSYASVGRMAILK